MVDGSKGVCAALMPPNYAAIDACDLVGRERARERLHSQNSEPLREGGREITRIYCSITIAVAEIELKYLEQL
jgi:hypothetical protein